MTMQVEQSLQVPRSRSDSFELFTTGIEQWWPLRAGFSYGGERVTSIHLEPAVGGRFFERFDDGDELQVGTVTLCEPPSRIVFTWQAPGWPAPTEVEVRFVETAEGTTIDLVHRLFERLGSDGAAMRDGFGGGWPTVLRAFGEVAGA